MRPNSPAPHLALDATALDLSSPDMALRVARLLEDIRSTDGYPDCDEPAGLCWIDEEDVR